MSIIPHRYDIVIYQGATYYDPFAIEAPDGTTYDLSTVGDGYTVGRLTIRDAPGGDAIVELTTDNGGVVIDHFTDADGKVWSGYVYMSAATTAALTEWGEGQHELEIADGTGPAAHVEKAYLGTAVLSSEVTT
jgi:hypothetical protein